MTPNAEGKKRIWKRLTSVGNEQTGEMEKKKRLENLNICIYINTQGSAF